MSGQILVEELTKVCAEVARDLRSLPGQNEKKDLVLRHIKAYANPNVRVNDFKEGLEWFNVSERLSMKQHLSGKIVILDFFTYCCINCMHILPDLDELGKRFSIEDGLIIIGVHSAKFSNEHDSIQVLSAIQRHNIMHPVVNDITLSMWQDMGIVCWPSLVILGPSAQPLAVFVGEGHKEELFLYASTALTYFKSSNQLSNHTIPMRPVYHLLPFSVNSSNLKFPGKLTILRSEKGDKIVISDTGNNRIIVTGLDGKTEDVIGGCNPDFKDGTFDEARFNAPQGVCVLNNIIYVADNQNHAIREIDLLRRTVSTIAGTGCQDRDYIGGKLGKYQGLSSPWDVAIYHHYDYHEHIVPLLIIAMAGVHQLWVLFLRDTLWWKKKKYEAGTCIAIVGTGKEENRNNTYPHAAGLAQPSGLAVAQEYKIVFFADSESSSIRQVHLDSGKVSAVCGGDKDPLNLYSFGDIDGSRHDAKLQHPLGIAWHPYEKDIYIADTYNHKIKKVDMTGACRTLYDNGKPSDTFSFNEPGGLAVSSNGNVLYVADTNNHTIKGIHLKEGTSFSIYVTGLPEEVNVGKVYTSDIVINKNGGKICILFDVAFGSDLKLNVDAPQRWFIHLPTVSWVADSVSGNLSDLPILITVSKGDDGYTGTIRIVLDLVACRINECIPKRFSIVYNVHQKSNGPIVTTDKKRIVIL